MRALVSVLIVGFAAYQEASLAAAAFSRFGLATGALMLFFCLLANTIFKAWWHGH